MNAIPWANVFWTNLTTSGTPSQTDLDTWLTALQAAYKTRFAGLVQSTVLFTQAQAQLFLPGNLILPSIVAMSGAGSGTATAGTDQASSMVVSWQTGVYWRGGKPRSYIPLPLAANIVNNKSLGAGTITNLTTAANGFRSDVNALTSGAISATQLGFVSFRSGNA